MIGYALKDRYRIETRLGRRGNETVYRCFDAAFRRPASLRIIAVEKADDVDRMLRQLGELFLLEHPNLLTFYDFGRANDGIFTVTEHVQGPTLQEVLAARQPLPPEQVLRVANEVLRGLEHIHEAGLLHCELTPSQIILSRGVLIREAGLACLLAGQHTGMDKRAYHYTSPEQLAGQPPDARSDLYSAGVILFEMLTGEMLFRGDRESVKAQQREGLPPTPCLPPPAGKVLEKLLSPDPAERHDSAARLRGELEKALSAAPIEKAASQKERPTPDAVVGYAT